MRMSWSLKLEKFQQLLLQQKFHQLKKLKSLFYNIDLEERSGYTRFPKNVTKFGSRLRTVSQKRNQLL